MKNEIQEVVKIAEFKTSHNLFSRGDICYGYSYKMFDEYVKNNNIVPAVIVKQKKSGQLCRFYSVEQKNEIEDYLMTEKNKRCENLKTEDYKPMTYVADILGINNKYLAYLSSRVELFSDIKKVTDENNRKINLIKCDEHQLSLYKEYLLENKNIYSDKEVYESKQYKVDEHILQLADIFNQDMQDYVDMMGLIKSYENVPLTRKQGYDIHHIVPRFYFKMNNILIDDSNTNLVNLPLEKHFIVHFLAYKCCKEKYRIKFFASVCILSCRNYDEQYSENIKELTRNTIADYRDINHVDRIKRKISEELKEIIKKENFNIKRFCQMCNYSEHTVNTILNCGHYSLDDLVILSNSLNVTLIDLLI